ncbi:mitochondrial distribution and morphology [Paramarasmius palmivorus]|uniref:Mitochondrial distribution and morphology n=1 Tax=Paramarasmius palmivorus TaxID=297713 RepID=A0AAW0DTZ9_9AGAR
MSSAFERQIRPVYDALDTGSNKSAIVACNKLLKKYPKNDLVKALKALALVRSQKVEESLVLCDEVLASKPTDDSTLTAMMHVLRGLGRHNDMVTMFEEAFKQQPGNEELGAQTFFANVRAGHWKSAQQADRYKNAQVIPGRKANDVTTRPDMKTILYKLAHRLITSSPRPSTLHPDRFYLHLKILRELGLYDEAATLLDSDAGRLYCATNLSCNELRRDIAKDRGLLKEEGERAEGLIRDKNDRNWLEFLSVLDATFSYTTSSDDASKEECSKHIAKSQDLFTSIAEADGRKERAGLLALLELEHRSRSHGFSDDPSTMLQLMYKYFETFGDKTCCYEDMKPYLTLPSEDLSKWTEFLESIPSSFSTINDLQRYINAQKLIRFNLQIDDLNPEAELSRAQLYTKKYLEGLPLGSDLPSTELQPADDLAILAASIFVNVWKITSKEHHLFDAAVVLEYGLTKSKQSFQMRLMLIRVYRLLGAPMAALEHYRLLGIKQVQNDTLSHFILSRASMFSLAATGDLTFSTECIEASQIYLTNSQETGEYVIRALTTEKYSQIPEFITFEDRLDNSLQRDIVKMEHLRMRLAHEPISSDVIDMELIELKFIFDRQHHDNRDSAILANYQPKIAASFDEQTTLLEKVEGQGWLSSLLKLYIRAFTQASDLDDTVEEKLLVGDRPKVSPELDKQSTLKDRVKTRTDEELTELTPHEAALIQFADTLSNWLEPYHDYARPPPSVVLAEAARLTEKKTGFPLKGVEIPPQNGNSHKKEEDPPTVVDAPEFITQFFEDMKARFKDATDSGSLPDILHVATVIQEAFLLFVVATNRFKAQSVVKINKLGGLVNKFKPIKTVTLSVAKEVASELVALSAKDGNQESRKTLMDACSIGFDDVGVQSRFVLNLSDVLFQIDHDFALNVAKKITDSRKKVSEGVGKGLAKLCTTYDS